MLKSLLKKIRRKWHADLDDRINDIAVKVASISRQTQNELSYLCDLYGSDKGSLWGGGGGVLCMGSAYLYAGI
jgi:uncharacterized protein YeeX (DUF496 family)